MAGFNFYIDGTLLQDEPEGFNDFTEEVILDLERRVLRFDYPITLIFVGDGYNIIEQTYQTGLNGEVSLEIRDDRQNTNKLVAKCRIRMPYCEWNINKRTVECDIDDATYQSRIFSNMKSEVLANAKKSITQSDITPITPLDLIVFNPVTGIDLPIPLYAFDVKDCFSMLIEYLTDGNVSFESGWYDDLPNDERIAIISGLSIDDNAETVAPLISLNTLFEEMWKKFNLFLIIENPLIDPVIRLEDYDYLFNSASYITIDYVQDLKRSLDFEQLYSTVRIGSETVIKEYGTIYPLPYFQFLTFSEELYTVDTNSGGGDNELGLLSQYVIDTNVIQDSVVNDSNDYEEEIFFVQYDSVTSTATKGTYYDGADPDNRFYNEVFLNVNVANRFNFAGNIILNNGLEGVSFLAEQTTPIPSDNFLGLVPDFPGQTSMIDVSPYPFEDDSTPPNFDDNDNYNNATYVYTASQSGLYRFSLSQDMSPSLIGDDLYFIRGQFDFIKNGTDNLYPNAYTIDRYVGGVFQQSFTKTFTQFQVGISPVTFDETTSKLSVSTERTIFLNSGDTLEIRININAGVITQGTPAGVVTLVFKNAKFGTVDTPTQGGVYATSDANSAYVNLYTASQLGILESEWEQVRISPTIGFRLNTNGVDFRICHGKKIRRKFVSGETKIEALYNRNQTHI